MTLAAIPRNRAIWAIGDVHGCVQSLDSLLARPEIAEDPDSRFWFVGDLVNRGSRSADTLRRVMALGDRATVVLGNHDFHALAIAAGCQRPGREDTLDDLFDAPDVERLLDWLRHRPLMHAEEAHVLVHAGVLPAWDIATALALAGEVEALLRDDGWRDHMRLLCGRAPTAWDASLQGQRRLRFIVAALTRMRLCTRRGSLAPAARATPGHWPRETVPWFDLPTVAVQRHAVVFGHWAALGLLVRGDVVCLDTGCVSGGALTAYRLSDRKLVQVCAQPASPLAAAYGERPRYRARPGRSARGRALPIQA